MKGLFESKLVLSLVAMVLLAGAVLVPLVGNFVRTYAQVPAAGTNTVIASDSFNRTVSNG